MTPKELTSIYEHNWEKPELSITLGDTKITRKYTSGAVEAWTIIGDFGGSVCLDVGYQYLLVEQPGMEPRRLVLLALLPKKIKIFDDDPCVAPEVWTDRERYVHMVAPDMSDFIKYDDHSFIISESGSSITFPYLVRIDKSMTSCGIDSKTLFLVDKELIDIARYAAWLKFNQLRDKGKKYARPIGALFYEEVYRRLHPLKKED